MGVLFFLLLFLLGARSRADVSVPPELLGLPLESVRFVSDAPLDEKGLRRMLPLEEGRPLRRDQVERAYDLLVRKDTFWFVAVSAEPGATGAALVIRLDRKQIVNSVRIAGFEHMSASEARRLARLHPGMIFDPRQVDAAIARFQNAYRDIGFPQAQIAVAVEMFRGEVDLRIDIAEGTPQLVRHVIVEGAPDDLAATIDTVAERLRGGRYERKRVRDVEATLRRELRLARRYEGRAFVRWEGPVHEGVVRIRVAAGPRFELEVNGNDAIGDDDLLRQIDLTERLVVTDGTWRELARRMERRYRERGYYRARVEVRLFEGDPKRVEFGVHEGMRFEVSEIRFRGVAGVPEERLRREIVTRPPRWWGINWMESFRAGAFVDEVFDDDLRRLWFLYRERGFEAAEIVDAPREFDEATGKVSATIVVEEGPKSVVRSVRYPEAPGFGVAGLDLWLRPGKSLGPKRLAHDQRQIARELARIGFADPVVEYTVERERYDQNTIHCDVTFTARYGPRRSIGQVIVQGNIDTLDRAVLRELDFTGTGTDERPCAPPDARPGPGERWCEPLSPEALVSGQVNVYRMGLFRSVAVRAEGPVRDGKQDVVVNVAERPPGRFEWGGGYNTRDGLSTFGEVGYDNLGGMARRIGLRGQIALDPLQFEPNQYLVHLFYREPRLSGSRWRFNPSVLGELATRTVDNFSVERGSLQLEADRPFWNTWRFGGQLQFEYSNVFDVSDDVEIPPLDETGLRTVALAPFLVRDTRDNPARPRRGTFDSIQLRWGAPRLSTVHFARVSVQHAQIVPLPWQLDFVYVARAGWGTTLDGQDFLPIRERFFLGGRDSVRGFAENEVGPKGKDGHPAGGDLALSVSTELRRPIYGDLLAAVFADGGGVYFWRDDPDRALDDPDLEFDQRGLSIDDFRRSAGLGLRYLTPVGPISLDYGFKLDRRGDESIGEIHFSIGARF